MKFIHIISCIALSLVLFACDDSDEPSMGAGKIVIKFDNRVGESDLELNKSYENASGEAFTVTRLNYFISNIRLTTNNGVEYVVPQDSSYFLIKESVPESQHITLNNIPAGDYNKITFTIGVDSIRSKMDLTMRTGVLDPASADGMYWTWNSGYIFFMMEGTSPAAPADQEHKFYYHIGGYGGYETPSLNNIREATISMGSAVAQVRPEKAPQVHLHIDILNFFDDPTISIAEHPTVMFNEYSKVISAGYVDMFSYDHVHN